jgi:hypothetical protein
LAAHTHKQHIGLSEAIIRACNHTAWLHGVTAGVAEIVREQYALAEADAAAAAAAGGQP